MSFQYNPDTGGWDYSPQDWLGADFTGLTAPGVVDQQLRQKQMDNLLQQAQAVDNYTANNQNATATAAASGSDGLTASPASTGPANQSATATASGLPFTPNTEAPSSVLASGGLSAAAGQTPEQYATAHGIQVEGGRNSLSDILPNPLPVGPFKTNEPALPGIVAHNALTDIGAPAPVVRVGENAANLFAMPVPGSLAARAAVALGGAGGNEIGQQLGIPNIPVIGNPLGLAGGIAGPMALNGFHPQIASAISPEEVAARQAAMAQQMGATPEELQAVGMAGGERTPPRGTADDVNRAQVARDAYNAAGGGEEGAVAAANAARQFDQNASYGNQTAAQLSGEAPITDADLHGVPSQGAGGGQPSRSWPDELRAAGWTQDQNGNWIRPQAEGGAGGGKPPAESPAPPPAAAAEPPKEPNLPPGYVKGADGVWRSSTESAAELARDAELRAQTAKNLGMDQQQTPPGQLGRDYTIGPNGEIIKAAPVDDLVEKLLGGLGKDERLPQEPTATGEGGGAGKGNGATGGGGNSSDNSRANDLASGKTSPKGIDLNPWRNLLDLWNAPSRILVGWHVPILRQGFGYTVGQFLGAGTGGHPSVVFEAAGNFFKALKDPEAAAVIRQNLRESMKVGPEGQTAADFLRHSSNERINPTVVTKVMNQIPLLQRVQNAGRIWLETLRVAGYKAAAEDMMKLGWDQTHPERFKDAWDSISHATGHGFSGQSTPGVQSATFLSPSYMVAQVKQIFDPFIKSGGLWGAGGRPEAIRSLVGLAGAGLLINEIGNLTGAKSFIGSKSEDLTREFAGKTGVNSQVGKVVSIGARGEKTAIDPWAGYQALLKLAGNVYLDIKANDQQALETHVGQYFRGRLGPTTDYGVDLLLGQDWKGDAFGPNPLGLGPGGGSTADLYSPKVLNRIAPIGAAAIWNAAGGRLQDGQVTFQNPARGLLALPSLGAMSVETTEPSAAFTQRMEKQGLTGPELDRIQQVVIPYFNFLDQNRAQGMTVEQMNLAQQSYLAQHPDVVAALRQGGYSVQTGTNAPLEQYTPGGSSAPIQPYQGGTTNAPIEQYQPTFRAPKPFQPRNKQPVPVGAQ